MTIVWIGVAPPWSPRRAVGAPVGTPDAVPVLASAGLSFVAGVGLAVMGALYGI